MSARNRPHKLARIAIFTAAIISACLGVKPLIHLIRTVLRDKNTLEPLPLSFVDDASRMSKTRVSEIWNISSNSIDLEQHLGKLLEQARTNKLRLCIAGACHSMGGHTIYPDGIVLNMLPLKKMALNEQGTLLHVQAGACWAEIIRYLNERGRSIAVMQSNNSFSVGGSVSANCHGWQHNSPPIASTVESFRLLQADGTIVECSRQEQAELFSLVLGGYGLFGVILDLELKVVANERYWMEQFVIPAERYAEVFEEKVNQASDVGMVYGRLNVGSRNFLREAILTIFHSDRYGSIPPLAKPGLTGIRRAIFRGTIGNEYGKELRWKAEKQFGELTAGNVFTRNQLLNEGVEVFENRNAATTDTLQEYFIPPKQVGHFLEHLRTIIPKHKGDLLNVTIRNVYPDKDSFLRYADQECFGLVMLFTQLRTQQAETQVQAMTQEIIECVLKLGGRYYLPYRLHASVEQFHRAYPQAHTFFELKRKYDPQELFQNEFYRKYGQPS